MQVLLSAREIDKLTVLRRIEAKRLSQVEGARILGISDRHMRRLVHEFREAGVVSLMSRRRGQPSNRAIASETRETALQLIRQLYPDYGPTLAQERLEFRHGIRVSRDTVRRWMIADGIWSARRRKKRVHQPRARRQCFGELVQADGSHHDWFEGRGPRCTLLVFIDDATGKLMELLFAPSETTWSYFQAMRRYLENWGRPVALYTDKHSVFRNNSEGHEGELTQFSRALSELDIDLICANTPQAKGRVERANRTLQDRLVKELRDHGVADIEAANALLEGFRFGFNRKFAKEPQLANDAHRRVRQSDRLDDIFAIQSVRKLSKDLTFQYKGQQFSLLPHKSALKLKRNYVDVFEAMDGSVRVKHDGRELALREPMLDEKKPRGRIVGSKALDAEVAASRARQKGHNPPKNERLAHLLDSPLVRKPTKRATESGHFKCVLDQDISKAR